MSIDINGIAVNIPELFGLGCIIGFLSGFFGIGGGALVTPILHIFFALPFPVCIGSTLAQTAGTSFSAVLRYWQFGDVDIKLALTVIGGNFIGIEIGVRALDWLDRLGVVDIGGQSVPAIQFLLQWIFFAILLVIAGLIFIESILSKTEKGVKRERLRGLLQRIPIPPYISFPHSKIHQISLLVITYSSLLIGVLTGMLGIGGGVIAVPLLIYGYGVATRTAIGTGLLNVFLASSYGTVTHAVRANVNLGLVAPLLIGSTICAQLGAMTTRRISGSSIRFYFAFVVLVVAGIILSNLLHLIYG